MMNPAGFLFGPNATVNVGGMVSFTSADYLRLGDGKLFNAAPNPNADALLSAAPVAAFGFLGSNPGAITVQGSQLSVTPGQSISLVGGNITIQSGTLDNGTVQPAHISAPNGQINLATAASPGEFLVTGLQQGGIQAFAITPGSLQSLAGPNVNGASFTSLGLVHLAKGSTVDTSQTGNSKVSIRGGQFVVDVRDALLSTSTASPAPPGQDNVLIGPGSSIVGATFSADQGPDVQIVADSIKVAGTPPFPGPPNFAFISTVTDASGASGNISLTATHNIDVAASTIRTNSTRFPGTPAVPPPTGASGNMSLTSTGGNISLTNVTQMGQVNSGSNGNIGIITLSAPHGDILVDGVSLISSIQAGTMPPPAGLTGGGGGGIQITANNLTLRHSFAFPSGIAIDNFSPQVPGSITINLSGNLSLDGQSFIQTVSRGPALAAADINVTAHNVSITNGSNINTQTISSGSGGKLNIFADNVQLTNGGQLRGSSVSGPDFLTGQPTIPSGAAGTINIQGHTGAAASVLIDGAGSAVFTNSQGTGPGGNTNIAAQSVTIQNGGVISAQANGSGPGGQVNISTENLQLTNGGQLTTESVIGINGVTHQPLPLPSGAGGDITVMATGSVTMTNGASISASSIGTGNAGNVQINAGQGFLATKSSVTTEANHSSGGKITITTNPNGTVQLTDSKISASVLDGTGGGGSVTIDPQFVLLQNSQILANAVFGPGGNIFITTNLLQPDATSVISASSQFGQNGTITVQSPIAPASRIIVLSQKPLVPTSLLTARCAALAGGNLSSFTVAGRESLPAEPTSWLSSPLVLATATTEPVGSTTSEPETQTSLSEPAEEMPILSVRRIAPPGFLTQSFAVDESGCTS